MTQRHAPLPKAAIATPGTARSDRAEVPARRHVDSATLFEGTRELEITHHGETYCLRVTRNEKLILTK